MSDISKLLFLGFSTRTWVGVGEVLRNNCESSVMCLPVFCCCFICLCLFLVRKLDLQPKSDTTPLHMVCIKVSDEFWIKINFVLLAWKRENVRY